MKHLLLICFFFLQCRSYASDSLKKAPDHIFDLSFSQRKIIAGTYTYQILSKLYTGTNMVNVVSEEYKIKNNFATSLGYHYLLNKKEKTANKFYIGLGINYLNFDMIHLLYSRSGGRVTGTTTSYSQYEFNYNVHSLSVTPNISYNAMFNHFALMNRLGVSLSHNVSKASYEYDIYTSHWDWAHTANNYVVTEKQRDAISETSLNISYQLGIGYRIKNLMPYISTELSRISKKFNKPYLQFQIGISLLLD